MNKVYFMLENSFFNRDLFRKINLIICLLYFMPSTLNVTNLPMKAVFVWGSLLALHEIMVKKSIFKMKYSPLILVFILSFGITIVLNRNYFFIPSLYNLGYLIISLIVIFPANDDQTKEEKNQNMYSFNLVFIIIIFLASVISIIQFLFLISYHVPTGTPGLLARQGFMEHRLFGIYTSPNVGAIFGYCSIVLSMLNSFIKNITNRMKIFYIFNFIVQVLYLILSSSRGGQLVVISFFIMFLLLFGILKYRKILPEILGMRIRWIVSIVILVLVVLSFGNSYAKNLLGVIPNILENRTSEVILDTKKTPTEGGEVVLEHSSENAELSAGRFTIWKAAITALEQKRLFGFGETDFYGNGNGKVLDKKRLSNLDESELKRSHGNMHNGYLQVLVSSGIVGFLLIYCFYACNILGLIREFFLARKVNSKIDFLIMGTIIIFIISFFIDEMVEAHLLFNKRDVVSIIFWYYLGYLSSMYLKKEN